MKTEVPSLFCLKAFAAIFVLLIHFHVPGQQYFVPITFSGVPIFFLIGGYFLFSGSTFEIISKGLKWCKKLLIIFFVTNLVYWLFSLIINGDNHIETIDDFFELFLFGTTVSGHLWFLCNYVWSLLLIVFFLKIHFDFNWLCVFAIGFILFAYIINRIECYKNGFSFYHIDTFIIYASKGFSLLILGGALRKVAVKHSFYLLLLSIIFAYAENRLLVFGGCYGGTLIGPVFLAISLVSVAINHPAIGIKSPLYMIGKYHSSNIYYWQYIPLFFIPHLWYSKGWIHDYSFLIIFPLVILESFVVNYIFGSIIRLFRKK